ncbi:transketolase [Priestia megaterium]|uniref:transketolase n=1 Tax=Priestia megaterium TaxID=1404 RepID=UPI003A7F98C3
MSVVFTEKQLSDLKNIAADVRKSIISTVHHAGAGHIGGPLSVTDLLVGLYFEIMKIKPEEPLWEERDRLVLSKGHSCVALYATLAHRGYFPLEELKTFDQIGSRLQGHPDMKLLPGLDMSTGSLGQGISAAVGMALGAKKAKRAFKTYCILGDGETQEGQVWEAADVASKYALDNLYVFIDNNKLQQYGWKGKEENKREIPTINHEERWESFGWNVITIDGHDFEQIIKVTEQTQLLKGKPTVIIANTVKGKGVSFMENQYLWHAKVPSPEELKKSIFELEQGVSR